MTVVQGGPAEWYTDQLITTHGLLASRVCQVAETSGLWRLLGLRRDPDLADTELCWHGSGYKNCNKRRHTVPGVSRYSDYSDMCRTVDIHAAGLQVVAFLPRRDIPSPCQEVP